MAGKTGILVAAGVGLLSGAGVMTLASRGQVPSGRIADKVRVANMDWSGKSTDVAREELAKWRSVQLAQTVTLTLPPETKNRTRWTVKRSDLGLDLDLDATLAEANAVGQNEGFVSRVGTGLRGRVETRIAPRWTVDTAKLTAYLQQKVAPQVARETKDARLTLSGESFHVEPDQPGAALDLDAAKTALSQRLTEGKTDAFALPVRTVAPHVTAEDLKSIEGEIGSYRTTYGESGNRARNIEVACRKLNGTVLRPGERFSYNKVVGPRESKYGFKMAPVIVSGQLEPGMGGGVCQTSSTLYNAVLLSNLKIVERSHHTFPVHYLPAGRDATVAYGDKDFQFENNTDGLIAIGADGHGGRVLMRIYGKKVPGRTVSIERTNVSSWGHGNRTTHDSGLAAGRTRTVVKGHAGHHAKVWRIVSQNGREVKRELVSDDTYPAIAGVVAVGTGASSAKPAAAPSVGTEEPGAE